MQPIKTLRVIRAGDPRLGHGRRPGPEADHHVVVVALQGELDASNVTAAFESINSVAGERCAAVVIDLREVVFLDSTALAVFVQLRGELGAERVVRLRNPAPSVRRVMQLTGLDELFGVR
jgi:anti-anti-sigma factor